MHDVKLMMSIKNVIFMYMIRDDNGAGREQLSLPHSYSKKKKLSHSHIQIQWISNFRLILVFIPLDNC